MCTRARARVVPKQVPGGHNHTQKSLLACCVWVHSAPAQRMPSLHSKCWLSTGCPAFLALLTHHVGMVLPGVGFGTTCWAGCHLCGSRGGPHVHNTSPTQCAPQMGPTQCAIQTPAAGPAARVQQHASFRAPMVPRLVTGQGQAAGQRLPMCCSTNAVAAHVLQRQDCSQSAMACRLLGPHSPAVCEGTITAEGMRSAVWVRVAPTTHTHTHT